MENLETAPINDLFRELLRRMQEQQDVHEVSTDDLHNLATACEIESINRLAAANGFLDTEPAVFR